MKEGRLHGDLYGCIAVWLRDACMAVCVMAACVMAVWLHADGCACRYAGHGRLDPNYYTGESDNGGSSSD